jgi:AraC family transcriptional regulator
MKAWNMEKVASANVDSKVPVNVLIEQLLANPAVENLLHSLDRIARDTIENDQEPLLQLARWLRFRGGAGRSHKPLIKWRLKRTLAYIEEHYAESITLGELAHAAGQSRMYFASQFRAATGYKPHEYVVRFRINRAMEFLAHSDQKIVGIAALVGFQSQAHFTTLFKRYVGMPPSEWRSRQASVNTAARKISRLVKDAREPMGSTNPSDQ